MANFTTPAGRMVQGDAFKPNTKDAQGEPLTNQAGEPRVEYHVAIAIPKSDPVWLPFKAQLDSEAAAAWPNGQFRAPAFSNKIEDGDSTIPNKKGIAPNTRVGFPGCWIVHLTNGFPPSVWARNKVVPETHRNPDPNPESWVEVKDGALLKKGYWIRVNGDSKSNNNQQSPGMYMNMGMIELVAFGEEIVTREVLSPDQAFGGSPTAAPVAAPTAAAPTASPTSAPAPAPAPAPAYTGFIPAVLTPKAAAEAPGVTYESFKAAGWNDDQLRAKGYIA